MTATDRTPRLLLIDGHSIAYRAFYALPVENFSTRAGQPTNAVFGFTSMLINLLRDEQPSHLAVAFDVSRQTFRSESYPEYKANRSSTPQPFQGQVSLIQEVLAALRIPMLSVPGYEADDVIATLTDRGRRARHAGADLHRRPGRAAAGQRPGHRAVPAQGRLRAHPVHPGGGAGQVRPEPGPVPGLRRAAR